MQDKTTLDTSDTFREYIEALVEEVVINGEPFEAQKKWLRKNSEAEGVDYDTLESNLSNLIEVLEEWKTQKTKSSLLAAKLLAKDCYLSETLMDKLTETADKVKTPIKTGTKIQKGKDKTIEKTSIKNRKWSHFLHRRIHKRLIGDSFYD